MVLLSRDMERSDGSLAGSHIGVFVLSFAHLLISLDFFQSLDDLVDTVAHFEHLLGHPQLLLFGMVCVQFELFVGGEAVGGEWFDEVRWGVAGREELLVGGAGGG